MGGYAYRVGLYELHFMDYHYDEIPEDGADSPQFFDTLLVDCEIIKLPEKWTKNTKLKTKKLSVPCSKLYTIKDHGDGTYGLEYDYNKPGPREWLFDTLKAQSKVLEIIPMLKLSVSRDDDEKYYKNVPDYYLQSNIGDEDIKTGMKPRTFLIENLEQLEWLSMRNFGYSRPFYPTQGSQWQKKLK